MTTDCSTCTSSDMCMYHFGWTDALDSAQTVSVGEFLSQEDKGQWVILDDLWACAGDAGSRTRCEKYHCPGPHHALLIGPEVTT